MTCSSFVTIQVLKGLQTQGFWRHDARKGTVPSPLVPRCAGDSPFFAQLFVLFAGDNHLNSYYLFIFSAPLYNCYLQFGCGHAAMCILLNPWFRTDLVKGPSCLSSDIQDGCLDKWFTIQSSGSIYYLKFPCVRA